MKYDVLQIVGAVLTAVAAQSAVHLLIDHGSTGLLGGLGVGFPVLLTAYAALTTAGVLLGGWSHARAKALGRRN
ncbi:hypothetical protein GCM10010211_07490 [Streptomyces albospinus]|uniref:Uncharacterized protein n=1 Tax=Streptomyces albospinus TaxID=285515 RepID=A0ABQ2UQG5_9ACTN|nr:hypothetical protein [Streptomyces albospinus]GGU46470.1 hypothetical protein GCM10010211_07490 [Streptomyces albospinus]